MAFNCQHEADVRRKIQKFWGSLTSMIAGGEHEYVYLRGIIDKIKYVKETKCKKPKKGTQKTPYGGMMGLGFGLLLAARINQNVAAGGSLAKPHHHRNSNSAPPRPSPPKRAASVLYHP